MSAVASATTKSSSKPASSRSSPTAPSPSATATPSSSSPPSPPPRSRKARTSSPSPSSTASERPRSARFPGGYFKREGRPSEKEILTCRMTDRPLRPLFPKGYLYDTQIITTLLSADGENDPDILSINGASAALMVSDIPFAGPVGAVRVGRVEGNSSSSPRTPSAKSSDLDLVYVGNENEIVMIEGSADGIAGRRLQGARSSSRKARPAARAGAEGTRRRASNKPKRQVALCSSKPSCSKSPTPWPATASKARSTRRARSPATRRSSAQGRSRGRDQGEVSRGDHLRHQLRVRLRPDQGVPRRDPRQAARATAARSRRSARSPAKSACSRARTVPRSSPAAKRRRSPRDPRPQRRGAGPRRLHRRRDHQAVHPPLQLPALLGR